jgi:hypothetical protein
METTVTRESFTMIFPLHAFSIEATGDRSNVDAKEFSSPIDAAKDAIGLGSDTKAFSDDVLREEICGPRQPLLTLVDLPGLDTLWEQTAIGWRCAEGVALCSITHGEQMECHSCRRFCQQRLGESHCAKFAREFDPKGIGTLRIITRPDMLPVGFESENTFLNLAKNEDVVFRFGWYVLRNRAYNSRECSVEERNKEETPSFRKVPGHPFLRVPLV